jgi:hypothetical protein
MGESNIACFAVAESKGSRCLSRRGPIFLSTNNFYSSLFFKSMKSKMSANAVSDIVGMVT